jgi:hypothetical protein
MAFLISFKIPISAQPSIQPMSQSLIWNCLILFVSFFPFFLIIFGLSIQISWLFFNFLAEVSPTSSSSLNNPDSIMQNIIKKLEKTIALVSSSDFSYGAEDDFLDVSTSEKGTQTNFLTKTGTQTNFLSLANARSVFQKAESQACGSIKSESTFSETESLDCVNDLLSKSSFSKHFLL